MHIDTHQHFWIYNPAEYEWIDDSMSALRRDFLPGDLEPELAKTNFHGSVAVQTRQTLEETRWLLELAQGSPSILGVVGWADLRSREIRSQLKILVQNGKLVGIRHIVQSEPENRFLLQPEFLRGIATLEEFDLAYDILIYTKHLPVAAEFVEQFPRQRFVLDHLAKPPIKIGNIDTWANGIRRLAEFPNVFCKLSGLVTEADWRLFTTLVRFDAVYFGHFKCNLRRLVDYPHLWGYARDLYQQPGFGETVDFDQIKRHYYMTHDQINPSRIVPKGPVVDWNAPHGRG